MPTLFPNFYTEYIVKSGDICGKNVLSWLQQIPAYQIPKATIIIHVKASLIL